MLPVEDQFHILQSGVDSIVPEEALKKKLAKGKPLNVKLGVDPTAPDIHIGHAVPLRKLRQFQDLGHQVTLIIGDGTALIGDPSGRNSTRPQLSREQVATNAKTYVDQAFKILNPEKTTLRYNSEWILKLDMEKLLSLMSKFTVARILERDDFTKRYNSQQPISLHEFIYPVMQAYDSVVIDADVEIGGRDQLFNLLAGRELMEKMGMEPQVCLTLPLLEGTDGVQKMSKSYGNYIGVTDDAGDMYGKVMSIPDSLLVKYYRLASTEDVKRIDEMEAGLKEGTEDPNKLKRALAHNIVAAYHGGQAADEAEGHFIRTVVNKEVDEDDVLTVTVDLTPNDEGMVYLARIIAESGMAESVGAARRLIDGGAVKIDGAPVLPREYNIDPARLRGSILRAGKRKYIRIAEG